MSVENRGGVPSVRRLSVGTTGLGAAGYVFPATSKYLQISNEGGSAVRVYFATEDYVADTNYIELPATTGFFEGPVESKAVWMRTASGTSSPVVMIVYNRRG